MSLSELVKLVPPPKEPIWNGEGEDLAAVERELGTRLPSDYLDLIRVYGSGTFCNTLDIFSPFGPKRLKLQHDSRREFYCGMLSGFPARLPKPKFPVYPEEGGILVVGGDEFSTHFCWLTRGLPDSWPLIWFDDYMVEYEIFDLALSEFLTEWVSGRIEPKVHVGRFPVPPLQRVPLFAPAKQL